MSNHNISAKSVYASNEMQVGGNNVAIANQNLLINGDFRVNQRGESSYTSSSGYTVDRWYKVGGDSTVTINDDGTVTHTTVSSAYVSLFQFIEFPSRLAGKTVTLSAKFSTTDAVSMQIRKGNTSSYTRLVTQAFSDTEVAIRSVSVTLPDDLTDDDGLYVVLMTSNTNSSTTWHYAKLEIGDHATAFSPRPYAEELALCQRYCYRMSGVNSLFPGYMFSASAGRFCVNLPTNLRTTPTITYADSGNGTGVDTMQCVVAEAYQTPTSIYVLENGAANVTLSLGLSGSIRELAMMRFLQYVIFDAEIYS